MRPVRKTRKLRTNNEMQLTSLSKGKIAYTFDMIKKKGLVDDKEEGPEEIKKRCAEKKQKDGAMQADEEAEDKNKEPPKKVIIGILKDVAVSGSIVGIILLVLYLFSGVWPPMVVIESSSMMHGPDSQVGVIDTGDLTLVQKVDDRSDIVTYIEATCRTSTKYGFKEYGEYGSVIVYKKNGKAETPVIHRAMAWVEYNASASDPSRHYFRGDLPDIGVYNVSEYYLDVTSYRPQNYLKKERMVIQISAIFAATTTSAVPHSGFITKGDHNIPYADQWVLYLEGGIRVEPVKLAWIVGKAQGELPWFGLFKLWITPGHDSKSFPPSSVRDLIITIIILVALPVVLDYLWDRRKRKKESLKKAGSEEETRPGMERSQFK